MRDRLLRKLVHIAIGIVVFLSVNTFGKWLVEGALCFFLLAGIFLQDQKIKGKKIPVVDHFLDKLGDKNAGIPGIGAMQYFVGLLLIISFLDNPSKINAGIAMLALGDGVASLIRGRVKWPHNNNKTLEGSAAFFLISALACYLYVGFSGVLVALLATAVESMPMKGISDNISVPAATVILFKLI